MFIMKGLHFKKSDAAHSLNPQQMRDSLPV